MRRPYRERFRLILSELGTGLAGRPEDLNEVIRRAHPALRETSETLAILRRQNKIIRDFIRDADTRLARRSSRTRRTWPAGRRRPPTRRASRRRGREELGRYWNRLPDFLAELEPTMAQLERTADQQIPTLRSLARARPPSSSASSREIEPFARASRGSIAALGDAAETRAARRCASPARRSRELRELVGERAAARQAAAPVPPDDRRPRALDRERPARPGAGAAGARQDRLQGRPGLHRHGGALELHLLPDARHQRVRRPRPPAADHRVHRRRLRALRGQAHRGRRSRSATPGSGPTSPA